MLYYLFEYLASHFDFGGENLYKFLSIRAGLSFILSLVISILFGKGIINKLRKLQIGETVRDLGLAGQLEKQGTPTMGGIIIVLAIVIPTLLFAKVFNIYILTMVVATLFMAAIGFADDYIKVFKKDKKGLHGKFKILGQVILGVFVGVVMLTSSDISVVMQNEQAQSENYDIVNTYIAKNPLNVKEEIEYASVKTTLTNMPFMKGNELDYSRLLWFLEADTAKRFVWVIFIPIVVFIVTGVSNGANLTDGIDGLATGTSAIIAATIGILAYLSGNVIAANYLNILYLPQTGELLVYASAFIGGCIGFLWYNSYPAQVFMGDTGSLMLGGAIATMCILIRKELLLPILCGIFMIESLSVIMQVSYFKYTKKKSGEGKRIFLMSPIHHHFQKVGIPEPKIVTRFWILGLMLAVFTIITLKIR
jgi:phospho-N-acetylmuramoyl-pentapeptide-transferase